MVEERRKIVGASAGKHNGKRRSYLEDVNRTKDNLSNA